MIAERITLRTNPLFEFEFLEKGFQIKDDSKENTNRFYSFELINKVEAKTKSTNFFITAINFILFSGPKYHYYDRQQLKFKYEKDEVVIFVECCDFETVLQISEKIKSYISNLNSHY
ncbi:hypothetical protein [Aequorivita vladivostokensis]|jgi:hypothetical protein|uniref:Uncharacterized protein n=1 Tax=Aequorivita vladivostokensis TaxID=171194 RepID=A0ABR5DJZ7_9FLAO|nr:hypothetical protein [Aequorivita vladivostokensis]KJJ39100.1 hypothetical protein MB09_06680 [Aequorivita vladivostokensis]HBL79568.1 hypothetical protein [Aequorivita sp.]|tara:strand:- start:10 stop:360 length:351 start_codon:yes stop_codon:yes gene_type:complete